MSNPSREEYAMMRHIACHICHARRVRGLKRILDERGTTTYAFGRSLAKIVAKDPNSWGQQMGTWASGKVDPGLSNCIIVADALGVTLDELADRTPPTRRDPLLDLPVVPDDAPPKEPAPKPGRGGQRRRSQPEGEPPNSA